MLPVTWYYHLKTCGKDIYNFMYCCCWVRKASNSHIFECRISPLVELLWDALGGVILLEEEWSCYVSCITGLGLWGFKVHVRLNIAFCSLLPIETDAKLTASASAKCLSASNHDGHGLTIKNCNQAPSKCFWKVLALSYCLFTEIEQQLRHILK